MATTVVRCRILRRRARAAILVALLVTMLPAALWPQATPTQTPGQLPKTAPQVQQVLPSYEGQNVSSVELAGRPDLNTSQLAPLLEQHAGQPFSRAKVDASVAALKRTGMFPDVQLEVRPEPQGVRVLFVLQPAIYFGIYEFPGAKHFAYARLLQVSNYPPRGPYTPVDVHNAEQALLTLFRRSGFFQAEVTPELQIDKAYGLVNVYFKVSLGRRAKFGAVDFSGTSAQDTKRLESLVHSFRARLHGAAIRPGKTYKLKTVQNASRYLEDTLTKRGHLAARVRLLGAQYNPNSNRADIRFQVQTGPLVHVKIKGAHVWSWDQHKLLPVFQQVGVNQELIQEGQQNLVSYFQSKGYFNAKVDTKMQQQAGNQTILYQIAKGPRHKVAAVRIAGNQHMPASELMPQVKVEKAHFFSHGNYSQHLAHESVEGMSALYKANGFANVTITPLVRSDSNGNLVVTFRVDEGPQDMVASLRLQGNTVPESKLAPKGLQLEPGKPYSQKKADVDRNHIMAQYLRLGYLTATFRETANAVKGQPHQLAVVYQIDEGPQVHTATVVTLGRVHTQQELINRDVANIRPGTPLTENEMLTGETRLYTPGVFDWAEIDPRRPITSQTEEDVLVKVHESPRNTLNYGFGFEVINRGGSVPSGTVAVPGLPPVGLPSTFKTSEKTFYGPRGTIQYTRNNLRGKGESISVGGLAGRLDQRGSFVYADPNFHWTKWASNLSISGEHNSENPIFTSRIGQIGFQLQRPLDEKKTQNFFIRYSFSQTGLTRLLIPALIPSQDRSVRLSTFSGVYIRDTRDNPLNAQKGIYESFELDMNPGVLSSVDFGKLLAQTAYYKKIPANIVWANSIRLGLEQPFAGSHVPLSEKFFSGGGSTLRGFPLNGAGPQRTIPACGNPSDPSTCSLITVPVGGNELFIVNSELRIPIPFDFPLVHKNLGFAAFYDGGNVFSNVGFHNFAANYTNTVGGGLRYYTPLGPIRFDIGHNLNAPPGIKSTQFFLTLGQAF